MATAGLVLGYIHLVAVALITFFWILVPWWHDGVIGRNRDVAST
jgi:hypothetical protein